MFPNPLSMTSGYYLFVDINVNDGCFLLIRDLRYIRPASGALEVVFFDVVCNVNAHPSKAAMKPPITPRPSPQHPPCFSLQHEGAGSICASGRIATQRNLCKRVIVNLKNQSLFIHRIQFVWQ